MYAYLYFKLMKFLYTKKNYFEEKLDIEFLIHLIHFLLLFTV